MDATRFALTKLQPPQPRSGLIERPELERRLGEAIGAVRLVLLSAPAGFGKTSALARQLASRAPQTALAWVACDEDDDLPRVLDCLCTALEPHDLPWRMAPEAIVAAVGPDRQALRLTVNAVVNALAGFEAGGVMVLEDTHRLSDERIYEWCDLLLERLPPGWTLVMTGRLDPPLALPRLRALGELAEFRTDDLRFTPDEAQVLATRLRPEMAIGPLWERTRGWAAGLRLALNAAPQRTGIRSSADRHAFDYLASEVLDALPADLRDFLLRSSILPVLTAARCAHVTGARNAAALLDEIERRGLFVSVLDGEEPTLTLNDLFRDCLEDRLQREQPEQLPELLRRAADGEPDVARRVGFLLRAADWAQAQRVLEGAAFDLVGQGATDTVVRLIEQFPALWRSHAPGLAFIEGVGQWSRWDFAGMARSMERATVGYGRANDAAGAQRSEVYHAVALCGLGQIADSAQRVRVLMEQPLTDDLRALTLLLRTWQVLDTAIVADVAPANALAVESMARVDRPEIWSRGQTLPVFVGLPGTAAVLERYVDGALRSAGDKPTVLRAGARAVRAATLLWQARFDEALPMLACAEEDQRWLGHPVSAEAFVRMTRALWHAWHGEAEAAMQAALQLLGELDAPRMRDRRRIWLGHHRAFVARIAMLVGDVDTLRSMHRRLLEPADPLEPALLAAQRIAVPAHVACIDGRIEDACAGYAQAIAQGRGLEVFGQAVELRLRLAALQAGHGLRGDAARTLADLQGRLAADQAAAPLMAGDAVLARLAAIAETTPFDAATLPPAIASKLALWHRLSRTLQPRAGPLPAFDADVAAGSIELVHGAGPEDRSITLPSGMPSATADASRMPDVAGLDTLRPAIPTTPAGDRAVAGSPLSERELEVLARIAVGDSNKLIARTLDLSPHTVKRHVANILDKLDLSTRGQAAAWHHANT